MKKLPLIYLLICFGFYQCQTISTNLKKNNPMSIIDSSFEKYQKTHYGINLDDNRNLIQENLMNNFINLTKSSRATYITITPKKGWFKIYKEFALKGNIIAKGIANKTDNNGEYGKLYEFDEQGNLTKTTDFEKDWQTSFETITEIA